MTLLEHYKSMALFNRWANERIYRICGQLDASDYFADRGAFFKSVHGTLQHLLVVDRLWMGRLTSSPSKITALDQVLYEDFKTLHRGRRTTDEEIIDLVDDLTDSLLDRTVTFETLAEPRTVMNLTAAKVLTNLFNHQTHHRGQVHTLLTQFGASAPPLDYGYFVSGNELGGNLKAVR